MTTGEAPNGTAPRNLYQRLTAITAEVQVKATGRTAQGRSTISIADTEDAIGDLMAEHGVVAGFRWNAKPEVVGQEGKVSIWMADITAWMVNADDPRDQREEPLFDVGTSPSAAVSFALKRYYRALFHLATEEDESRSVGHGDRPPPAGAGAPPASDARGPRVDWKTITCPRCGRAGFVAQRRDKTGWFCSESKGGCGQQITNQQADAAIRSAGQQPAPDTAPAQGTLVAMLTAEQREELAALNAALPQDLRLTDDEKRALAAHGFSAMKEALLDRETQARSRSAP
jgi:ribosomal protein S27AE